MVKYRHLFFDLDRTLWDYQTAARETIGQLMDDKAELHNVEFSAFFKWFDFFNDQGWMEYLEGKVKKNDMRINRFSKTLSKFKISNHKLAELLADQFSQICPTMPYLIEGAKEVLDYTYGKYNLYILTNGFTDIQITKLKSSGIYPYFKKIFTTDLTGASKPNKAIFHYSLSSVHALKKHSLMIGDDYKTDILGAHLFGIDNVWFNNDPSFHPEIPPTLRINKLIELKIIL